MLCNVAQYICFCSSSCSCLSIYLCIYLSIYLPVCVLIYLSMYPSVYLSAYLQAWKRSYFARLTQFLNLTTPKSSNSARHPHFSTFRTWQHQKRNNSARLSHFSKLTTSKTKQFCEASFNNGKLSAKLTASCQCFLRFFHSICLKYCA